MGDYRPQLKGMLDSIAEILHNTGDFSVIEPGYKFSDDALNKEKRRHIYLEQKDILKEPSYRGNTGKILLNLHHDTMNGKDFIDKLVTATHHDIHSANILHRYINSYTDKKTQGPLFRRFVLDEDKKKNRRWGDTAKILPKSRLHDNGSRQDLPSS